MEGTKRDGFEHKTILLAKMLGPEDPSLEFKVHLYIWISASLVRFGLQGSIGIYKLYTSSAPLAITMNRSENHNQHQIHRQENKRFQISD